MQHTPDTSPDHVPRRFRGIRLATVMIGIAVCAVLLGLGVELYRAWSPVRRWARQSRPGNPRFTRLQAVQNLTYNVPALEREAAFPILLEAVKDPDPMIRGQAMTALRGRRDHYAEVVAILRVFMKDPDPGNREAAILHLESFVKPGTPDESTLLPEVMAALEDPSPSVRLEACRALYVYGQLPRAVPTLTRMVREEKGGHRQGALGWLLVGKTIPKELEPTLRAMPEDTNDVERDWRRQALIRMGVPDQERDALIRAMLESSESAERFAAAQILVDLGKPLMGVSAFKDVAARGDRGWRERAVQGLVNLLSRPGGDERRAAAEVLIQMGRTEAAMPILKELADHGDPATSAWAARLLDAARDRGEAP